MAMIILMMSASCGFFVNAQTGSSCANAVQLAKRTCGKVYSKLRDDPKSYDQSRGACGEELPVTRRAKDELRDECEKIKSQAAAVCQTEVPAAGLNGPVNAHDLTDQMVDLEGSINSFYELFNAERMEGVCS